MNIIAKNKNRTKKFLDYIEQLKNKQGISYRVIADTIGVKYQKIQDMKGERSSANKEMIDALLSAYPGLKEKEQSLEPSKSFSDHVADYPNLSKELNDRMTKMERLYFEKLQIYKDLLEKKEEELKETKQKLDEKDKQLYQLINKILEKG